jgi:hypothetical protein
MNVNCFGQLINGLKLIIYIITVFVCTCTKSLDTRSKELIIYYLGCITVVQVPDKWGKDNSTIVEIFSEYMDRTKR